MLSNTLIMGAEPDAIAVVAESVVGGITCPVVPVVPVVTVFIVRCEMKSNQYQDQQR